MANKKTISQSNDENIDNEKGDILFYETEDGSTKIDVKLIGETVWLSQSDMCKLFDVSKSTISEHISNIFNDGELEADSVVRNFRITASDGKQYKTNYYNLDTIISVGYRVKSLRGTQFRIWATQRIREYIIKGFTMNDDMLKKGGYNNYFEELLARIRDIRSSEKVFYRKILDIFSTGIDYNPESDICKKFFKVVQNKFHYAVHGHTASEIIHGRVDAEKIDLGLTSFAGKNIIKSETHIAKNYLSEDELDKLNRLVTIYLEFVELQALDQKVIRMEEHLNKVDDILKMTGREILENAGGISHKKAIDKADSEYDKYKKKMSAISKAEKDLIDSLEKESIKLKNNNNSKS